MLRNISLSVKMYQIFHMVILLLLLFIHVVLFSAFENQLRYRCFVYFHSERPGLLSDVLCCFTQYHICLHHSCFTGV